MKLDDKFKNIELFILSSKSDPFLIGNHTLYFFFTSFRQYLKTHLTSCRPLHTLIIQLF